MNQLAHQNNQLGLVEDLALSASLSPEEFRSTLLNTVMPGNVTEAQLMAFLMVAQKYDLNPITKEIYAFPSRGGINPIVSIDGWLKIINSNEQFDGMEFSDQFDDGNLVSVTCKIFRKDRSHPTEVTEYMNECRDKSGKSEPWKKWPARMLRHKATIQAARYAFGLSGIYDPDEGERIDEAQVSQVERVVEEKVINELPKYTQDQFDKNVNTWITAISKGKTAAGIVGMIKAKYTLSPDHEETILNLNSGQQQ